MDYASINNLKYAFIGGGKIAGIFIERIIRTKITKCTNIITSDINADRRHELHKRYGIHVTDDNRKTSDFGDVVFMAVPPGEVKAILSESCNAIDPQKKIISLAAVVPTWIYESVLCKTNPIIRVIPNLPSLIGVQYLDEHEIHSTFSSAFTRAYEKIERAEEKITA